MERLTNKLKFGYSQKGNKTAEQLIYKLGQLEDLMENHCIDTIKYLDAVLTNSRDWLNKKEKEIELLKQEIRCLRNHLQISIENETLTNLKGVSNDNLITNLKHEVAVKDKIIKSIARHEALSDLSGVDNIITEQDIENATTEIYNEIIDHAKKELEVEDDQTRKRPTN